MQEKVEIITNHFEHYWTKIPKNGYCDDPQYAGINVQSPQSATTPRRPTLKL